LICLSRRLRPSAPSPLRPWAGRRARARRGIPGDMASTSKRLVGGGVLHGNKSPLVFPLLPSYPASGSGAGISDTSEPPAEEFISPIDANASCLDGPQNYVVSKGGSPLSLSGPHSSYSDRQTDGPPDRITTTRIRTRGFGLIPADTLHGLQPRELVASGQTERAPDGKGLTGWSSPPPGSRSSDLCVSADFQQTSGSLRTSCIIHGNHHFRESLP
jgi:hypothetical protein